MLFINTQKLLNEFCSKLLNSNIVSIDTEFERRNTYYAILSIIQIKSGEHIAVVDALTNLDLTIFKQILINDKILKLFHAPREDIEIFYHLFGIIPNNVFDIQIAANICGFGKQISYEDICYSICNVTINKTYQKSDWIKRPISVSMLEYAVQDVEYLEVIYQKLNEIIAKNNLANELNNRLQILLNIKNYNLDPENAWLKIKFFETSENFKQRLQNFAAYRERQARKINIPRKHFILDEDLIKLSNNLPLTDQDFKKLRLKSKYLQKHLYKDQIIGLCKKMS